MEEINHARQGKPEQTFDVAFGTIFRIKKCFQRSKQKVNIHFLFKKSDYKFFTICTGIESTDLIL